jgi:hypothetical protein
MQEKRHKQRNRAEEKHGVKERNSERKGKKSRQKETDIQVLIAFCHKVVFLVMNTYLGLENHVVELHVENVDTFPPRHYINTRREWIASLVLSL